MKHKIFGAILTLLFLASCTTGTVAFAQSSEYNIENPTYVQIEFLDAEYSIVTETRVMKSARSTTQTKFIKRYIVDSKNVEQCAFYLYGDFNSDTRQCVRSYYTTSTSGGSWHVEEPAHWHDGYTAYGSCVFVRRVLGIKIEKRQISSSISY